MLTKSEDLNKGRQKFGRFVSMPLPVKSAEMSC